MTDADLAGMAQLRATPRILRELAGTVTEEEAGWKPSPERWSVVEVLGHLVHVESLGFRGRLERIAREDNPQIEPYDPDAFAAAGAYGGRTMGEALGEFERERERSLLVLEVLPPAVMTRRGVHGKLGSITAGNLLHEWPLHDLGHIRQVAELIRAAKYYPHIGPWQSFYTVNP